MRKVKLLMALMLCYQVVFAQANPVQWEFKAKKTDNQHYEVNLTAVIHGNWHIYSQFTAAGGPVPTKIHFNQHPLVVLSGPVNEIGKLHEKHEEVFDVNVKYYEGKVVFVQKLHVKKKIKTTITGTVEYMLCNDKECLPPKKETFSISL